MAFTTQPGGGTAGEAWAVQPAVTLRDAYGNTVMGTAQTVTLAIQINPPGDGVLSGATSVAVKTGTGVATFGGLSIDKAGTGYTLTATGSTVSTVPGEVVSASFDIAVDQSSVVFLGGPYDGWDRSVTSGGGSLKPGRTVIRFK